MNDASRHAPKWKPGPRGIGLLAAGALSLGALAAASSASASSATGFASPSSGTPRVERFSAPRASSDAQVNVPLGRKAADRIALGIGLDPSKVLTPRQRALLMSGKGVGGQRGPAKLIDASMRILTNTWGRPLVSNCDGVRTPTVLGSYGLTVNRNCMLSSSAQESMPTRKVNEVLMPGGYMGKWMRANGARAALANLYASAYTREAYLGYKSQQISGMAQLVPNQRGTNTPETTAMPMAPSIYIANFALIYILNPNFAAKMPAYWTAMPTELATALRNSPTGQVPYQQFRSMLPTPG
jgi:hypothetical protein